MGVTKSETEYVFKVHLKGAKRVARTVALRGDQTLDDLHEAIFAAFDRFDAHLYSFYFPKAPNRRRATGSQTKEYTAPQMFNEPDASDGDSRFDASATSLDDLRLKPGQKFEYLFDFGDCWWHEGTVEAVSPSVPRARYPQIRASRGISPPQYEAVDE
jgi:hypothetical protein